MQRSVIVMALVIGSLIMTSVGSTWAAEQWDSFDQSLQDWEVYRGTPERTIIVDMNDGWPSAPSVQLLESRTPVPDPATFGSDTNSIFWSNPVTRLSDFKLSFWIKFDSGVGKALITFRMQNDRNYYAALLSDTHDWYSGFYKFVDGVGTPIGNQTKEQGIFREGQWSHVELNVEGSRLVALMDGSPLFDAIDMQFASAEQFGIGVYNGYIAGSFKVDSFLIQTNEKLVYTKVLTTVATATETVPTTVTETIKITMTQVTTYDTTSHLVIYDVSTITRNETTTSTHVVDVNTLDGIAPLLAAIAFAFVGVAAARAARATDKPGAAVFGTIFASSVGGGMWWLIDKLDLGLSESCVVVLTALVSLSSGAILGFRLFKGNSKHEGD